MNATVNRRTEPLVILIIEDNPADATFIRNKVVSSDLCRIEVLEANSLRKGIELASSSRVDLILLDLSLPDSKGLNSLFEIKREFPELPIIVLTGLPDQNMIFEAIQNGAQDYLLKDDIHDSSFVRTILCSLERHGRQMSQLRTRLQSMEEFKLRQVIFKFGSLEFHTLKQAAYLVEGEIKTDLNLTPAEFKILFILLQNREKTLSRREILEKAWEKSRMRPHLRTIDRHIAGLRKKSKILNEHIQSIHRIGYRFQQK